MATQPQTWTEDVAMDFSLSTGGDGFFSGGNKYASKMLKTVSIDLGVGKLCLGSFLPTIFKQIYICAVFIS